MQNTLDRSIALEKKSSYCRRRQPRAKLHPYIVSCWTPFAKSRTVSAVEADVQGARLVLPFEAKAGQLINVTFTDHLGQHQTRQAKIVWTERMALGRCLMAGVQFSCPMLEEPDLLKSA